MPAGIRTLPREDQRAYEREYYAKNREKLLAKAKEWQAANPEYVKTWRKMYSERWRR